jgi:hypothetical protein
MFTVTFEVFEPDLNKTLVNVKKVKTMDDFRLYADSLWNSRWKILSFSFD